MANRRLDYTIEPMTLGNMRANGVRSLDVSCWQCHHRAILTADPWPDHVPVPTFGPRMVCTKCGIIGADARPNLERATPRCGGVGSTAGAFHLSPRLTGRACRLGFAAFTAMRHRLHP